MGKGWEALQVAKIVEISLLKMKRKGIFFNAFFLFLLFQNPFSMFGSDRGAKPGSAGVPSQEHEAMARRERLRKLAIETIDLSKVRLFQSYINEIRTLIS